MLRRVSDEQIRDVRVFDGERVAEHRNVLVRGGLIDRVGGPDSLSPGTLRSSTAEIGRCCRASSTPTFTSPCSIDRCLAHRGLKPRGSVGGHRISRATSGSTNALQNIVRRALGFQAVTLKHAPHDFLLLGVGPRKIILAVNAHLTVSPIDLCARN
jgi:hypothetical protein